METLNKEKLDQLVAKVNQEISQKKVEMFWDYNDELSEEQINVIIKGNSWDVEEDIRNHNVEYIGDLEDEARKKVISQYKDEFIELLNFNDYNDETHILEELEGLGFDIEFPAVDLNLNDLIKRTKVRVRVTLHSNYDCINSHWFEGQGGYEYKESYFGAMVDFLKLNPAKVKRMLVEKGVTVLGAWPNYKARDGKELVDYEDFYVEMENSCCPANNLILLGEISLSDFVDVETPTKLFAPKGSYLGIYSSSQGGGSVLEMKLKEDTVFKLGKIGKTEYDSFEIVADTKENGYTTDQVYGLTSQCFKRLDLRK